MATRSNSSRERILDCAQEIILQKGFSGTSIDEILEKSAITKGGFFYHFDGKPGLAKALAERYLVEDAAIFDGLFKQADELSENPLHQLLIFLKLFAEMMGNMETTHPGCLVVSFTYENQQFDEQMRELIRKGIDGWRDMLAWRLENIVKKYPPKEELNVSALSDLFTSAIEGGIILSRAYSDKKYLVEQVLSYRNYIRLLFEQQ